MRPVAPEHDVSVVAEDHSARTGLAVGQGGNELYGGVEVGVGAAKVARGLLGRNNAVLNGREQLQQADGARDPLVRAG